MRRLAIFFHIKVLYGGMDPLGEKLSDFALIFLGRNQVVSNFEHYIKELAKQTTQKSHQIFFFITCQTKLLNQSGVVTCVCMLSSKNSSRKNT